MARKLRPQLERGIMLQPGTSLHNGQYRVIETVGKGGMGVVYRASHRFLEVDVAIKEMHLPGAGVQTAAVEQFKKEAQLLSKLKHPNLVRVTDCFEDGGHMYLVMDFVRGRSLDAMVNQATDFLDVPRVLRWIYAVCDVLSWLHDRNPPLVYRDLKPSNIMLDEDDHLWLVDFGIVRALGAGDATSTILAWTPGYAPLEQYGRFGTTPATDVYALGATLYTLLTRVVPPASVELQSGDVVLQTPSGINPAVSPALEVAILKMMALRKQDRFQTVAEARQALEAAAVAGPDGAVTVPPARATTGKGVAAAASMSAAPRSADSITPTMLLERLESKQSAAPARRGSRTFLTVLLLAVLLGLAGAWSVLGTTKGSTLTVRTTPGRADVTLDGSPMGRAPATTEGLTAGDHTLRVTKVGFEPQTSTVHLAAGETRAIDVQLQGEKGRLTLEVRPPGADLYLNDAQDPTRQGLKESDEMELQTGTYRVKLVLKGYKTWVRDGVIVDAATPHTLNVALTPEPTPRPTATPTPKVAPAAYHPPAPPAYRPPEPPAYRPPAQPAYRPVAQPQRRAPARRPQAPMIEVP